MPKSVKRKPASDKRSGAPVKPKAASVNQKAAAWPAASVELRPIVDLLAYPQNPMIHSEAQIQQIAASMREFGWTIPMLVDESGVIIAGHGRLRAAQQLGITKVPVMTAAGWTAEQRKAYRIADNQLPRLAEFDQVMLRTELTDLKTADYPLELLGFDDLQLVTFMAGVPNGSDPEHVPEPLPDPVSRKGDLWLLGKHRLLCGDATSKADIERLLDDAKPHLMVTDPPYGVNYDPNWRNEAARHSEGMGNRKIGAGAVGKVQNDNRADWQAAYDLFAGNAVYVWCASLHSHEVADSMIASGFELRSQIIWDKTRLIIGRGDYHWQHEPCWYAVRKGKPGGWAGDRKQTTVWAIPHQVSETGHSTQKPIECMKRPIENNSRPGDAVYDPFVGSGTTLIAAEMIARVCLALDVDPIYVDVAVRRWQAFTQREATLEGSGKTFEQVVAERKEAPKGAPRRKPRGPAIRPAA